MIQQGSVNFIIEGSSLIKILYGELVEKRFFDWLNNVMVRVQSKLAVARWNTSNHFSDRLLVVVDQRFPGKDFEILGIRSCIRSFTIN